MPDPTNFGIKAGDWAGVWAADHPLRNGTTLKKHDLGWRAAKRLGVLMAACKAACAANPTVPAAALATGEELAQPLCERSIRPRKVAPAFSGAAADVD